MLQAFAITLPIIILMCGLSIDVGLLELKHAQMQSAADAAALSAELEAERGTGNWVAIGQQDAAVGGFTNGSHNTTVTITELANYGPYSGRYDGLQVTISEPIKTIFMGTLNGGYVTVTASSVALMTPCVYLLGTGRLQNQSMIIYTGSVNANSCPVDTNTIAVEPSGHIAVEAINVAGTAGSSTLPGFVYPTPQFNVPTVTDPLAAVTSPTFSGTCNHTSYALTSGTATLSPGTYCKGLNISNATVTLNPGLYVITGGGTWTNSNITGTGVTLYFTSGGGASYGVFLVQYGTNLNLSAPTDASMGGIPAISIFADRNWVATGGQDFQFVAATVSGDGIWYIPGAGVELWSCGNVTATHYLGLVADNIFTAGSIYTPLNDYSYVTTGNPFRKLGALVQ